MKKLFNHSKKPYENEQDLSWDETEYSDEFVEEESYEEEYADDAEEAYADEEYDGELTEEEDYYGEDGEFYGDEEAGVEEEFYEEESYEEEIYEDEVYEEDLNEEYEGSYEEEESEEEPYDEEFDDDELEWSAMSGGNAFQNLWQKLIRMSTMDKIVASTGVIVLVLVIVTGTVLASASAIDREVSVMGSVGSQLNGITLVGEQGLMAVADAERARIEAANAMQEEEEEKTEYEESEYSKEIEVSLNMTSIEKDLKLKIVNKKTNKLIPNIPFTVTVTTPDGKTETWTDDDMDGIIYKTDITPGKYKVALNVLEDSKYEDYKVSTSEQSVTVKKEIAYEKVDVGDEIKGESEVDAKVEDTKEEEIVVESTLTDTVAWVESTKTVIDSLYTAVPKKTIVDPLATARATNFLRTATVNVTMNNLELTMGTTVTGSVAVTAPGDVTFDAGSVSYTSSDTKVATVDASGNVTALNEGTVTITFKATVTTTMVSPPDSEPTVTGTDEYTGSCTVKVNAATPTVIAVTGVTLDQTTAEMSAGKTLTLVATVAPTDATDKTLTWTSSDETVAKVDANGVVTALKAGKATITATSGTVKATCEVTVKEAGTLTLKLDKPILTAALNVPTTLTATLTNSVSGGDISGTLTVTSSDTKIAEVKEFTTKDGVTTITITPKAKGTATITVSHNSGLTAVCNLTVTEMELTLEKATLSVLTAAKTELAVTVKGTGGTYKIESDNTAVATVGTPAVTTTATGEMIAKADITGVKEGSATITITYTVDDVSIKKTCTVTVKEKDTKLLDGNKKQLYVLQSDGKYREATYADYYDTTIENFYLKTEGVVKYTGWQTLDGKLYFFDASGKAVTGEQVIQGAKYNFASDGSMVVNSGTGTFGIDVSKWQGTIDWNAVKNSGVNYVIIRCGYRGSSTGALIEDPKYKSNIKGAINAGLKVGVYFFSQAVNRVEAVEEASMVLQLIKDYKISYPVFLDVEGSGGRADNIDKATRTDVIKAFCETIQNSGYTAGVYANKSWLTNKIDTSQLGKYKIWLAQYAATPTYTGRYDLWQYKSTGKVSGISTNVDMNLSYLGY